MPAKTSKSIGIVVAVDQAVAVAGDGVVDDSGDCPYIYFIQLSFSGRILVLIGGDLFLLFKGVQEIHLKFEIHKQTAQALKKPT